MLGGMWRLGLGNLGASRAQSTWIFLVWKAGQDRAHGPDMQGGFCGVTCWEVLQGRMPSWVEGSKVGVCPQKTRNWDQPV